MIEVHNIADFKLEKSVVTIGIFDGIHLGHRELIHRLITASKKFDAPSVLITMWPHPRKVLFPDKPLSLLTSFEEKKSIIKSLGVDYLIAHPFNADFANISYSKFVTEHIVQQLGAQYVVIGFNHHFGKNREGNFHSLKTLSVENSFVAEQLEQVYHGKELISSSEARNHLLNGEVKKAAQLLSYAYKMTGEVVEGKKLGRTIGFPTANIKVSFVDKLIPKDGVYAVRTEVDGIWYDSMMNIGTRPTVSEERKTSIEVHLFEFEKDLYNKTLNIEFIDRLRDEMKFNGIDQLKEQLTLDAIHARQLLKK